MTDRNALGLPLVGEEPVFNRRSASTQLPIEDLQPMIEAVFMHDDVDSVRWRAFTPWFNDGDVCEFSVSAGDYHGFVKLKSLADRIAEDEDEEESEGYLDADAEEIKGGHKTQFMHRDRVPADLVDRIVDGYSSYVYVRVTDEPLPVHPAHHDLKKLQDAINSGSFENALYSTFGDHVTVTVYRDKIELERYEHD